MARDTRRADRVAEAIREEVASYLTTGAKDPRIVGFVTVTGVDVTPDLRRARVYVSVMGSDAEVESTLAALNDVGNRIKGQVGRTLRLRLAPELDFRRDDTAARAARIEMLLQQIKAEERGKGSEAPSDTDFNDSDQSVDHEGRDTK
jgi:ribosome-binding factor A